jgi:subtilisin family serine protease
MAAHPNRPLRWSARRVRLLACVLVVAVGLLPGTAALASPATDGADATFSAAEVADLAETGRVVVRDRDGNHHPVDVADERAAQAVAAQVRRDPHFVALEVDAPVAAAGDPLRSQQWEHPRLRIAEAHRTATGRGVVVAVLDTGVQADHIDLAGRVLPGYNAIERVPGLTGDGGAGHGTRVAGMIAAIAGNGVGMAGAAPDVRILPVTVLKHDGNGRMSDVAHGIEWAVHAGADVINLSLAGDSPSSAVRSALRTAQDAGVIVVASAGNLGSQGNPVMYPAAFPETVAVGATDQLDRRASFSGYHDYIDVVAPGVGVTTTTLTDLLFGTWNGTSASAPLVSATAALALEAAGHQDPSVDHATAIVGSITSTAHDLGAPGHDPHFGHGLVQADQAVRAAALLDPAGQSSPPKTSDSGSTASGPGTSTGTRTPPPTSRDACPSGLPAGGFTDTRGSVHEHYVDCMAWWGITAGVAPGRFAPQDDVTRAQIATFLHRTLDETAQLPSRAPRASFRDVSSGHTHVVGIETLAGLGVIHGTDASRFSPGRDATRGQMASLIVRMHEEVVGRRVTPSSRSFPDIAGSPHETNIRKLVALEVTTGFPDGTFQPSGTVTRGQMATFVMRYVEHLAAEGLTTPPAR